VNPVNSTSLLANQPPTRSTTQVCVLAFAASSTSHHHRQQWSVGDNGSGGKQKTAVRNKMNTTNAVGNQGHRGASQTGRGEKEQKPQQRSLHTSKECKNREEGPEEGEGAEEERQPTRRVARVSDNQPARRGEAAASCSSSVTSSMK
jgi:hypothetical protein